MSADWLWFTVDLELTNHCHGTCIFCPREKISRPKGFMDQATFMAIADKLRIAGSRVTFCGMGEPLLHPKWSTFVRYLREHGGTVGLQVSASALTETTIAALVDARPSFVEVSLPALDPESLAFLVPGCVPETLVSRTHRLVDAARGIVPVRVIGLRTARDAVGKEDLLEEHWRARGAPVRVLTCHTRGGNLTTPGLAISEASWPRGACGSAARSPENGTDAVCGLASRHAFITWDGNLLLCCHDLSGETAMGNVATADLPELAARRMDVLGSPGRHLVCARCDEPLRYLPVPSDPVPKGRSGHRRSLRRLTNH